MTIEHKGIRRKTTDVLEDYGQAHYLQNARLKRIGELGRRAGLGKSTMAQLAGPVQFMIAGWNYEPYIVNGTGGSLFGNADPLAKWTGSTLRIPEGEGGTCVRWGPFSANGTFAGGAGSFTLPAVGSCAGTWTFTVTDPGPAPYYGMSLGGSATVACLQVGSATGAVAAGTTTFTYTVSGGCNGGGTSPTWTLTLTQP